jgi:hypothetical protein
MEKKILFRSVIEVLGKPKEHVGESLKSYIQKLKDHEKYEVVKEDIAEIKQHEDSDLWAIFAELEVWTEKIEDLTFFCFEFMPSLIDVIEPTQIEFKNGEVSEFINDLQAKLHQVDMVAKHAKSENEMLKVNMGHLVKNYLSLLLMKKSLTSQKLSNLTGIKKDILEDYLDKLIDEGKVDLEGEEYHIVKKEVEAQ